jgi:hypothetical protein
VLVGCHTKVQLNWPVLRHHLGEILSQSFHTSAVLDGDWSHFAARVRWELGKSAPTRKVRASDTEVVESTVELPSHCGIAVVEHPDLKVGLLR